MQKYLVTIHRPNDDALPFSGDESMGRDIDLLNDEMVAAGIRVFVGGLRPVRSAKSVRLQAGGKLLVTDGSHSTTSEYVDGLWVLEAVDIDEALKWGQKAALACRASVEVRPFY